MLFCLDVSALCKQSSVIDWVLFGINVLISVTIPIVIAVWTPYSKRLKGVASVACVAQAALTILNMYKMLRQRLQNNDDMRRLEHQLTQQNQGLQNQLTALQEANQNQLSTLQQQNQGLQNQLTALQQENQNQLTALQQENQGLKNQLTALQEHNYRTVHEVGSNLIQTMSNIWLAGPSNRPGSGNV